MFGHLSPTDPLDTVAQRHLAATTSAAAAAGDYGDVDAALAEVAASSSPLVSAAGLTRARLHYAMPPVPASAADLGAPRPRLQAEELARPGHAERATRLNRALSV